MSDKPGPQMNVDAAKLLQRIFPGADPALAEPFVFDIFDFVECNRKEGEGLLNAAERLMILAALRRTFWQQNRAAELLGVSARVIHYQMGCHGLERPVRDKRRARDEGGNVIKMRRKHKRQERGDDATDQAG